METQKAIFDLYWNILRDKYIEYSDIEITNLAKKYVAIPSKNISCPSPHSTGGSVDLSIINAEGNLIDTGTSFDDFTILSRTRFLEKKETDCIQLTKAEKEQQANRRLLFGILRSVGFTNYYEEWWHYDYGNQFWGKLTNNKAIYGISFKDNKENTG